MQFAGDYKLESVIVHSASGSMDIKDLILELNVYESIHSSNLYGNLTIMDSANHVQNLPIIGQEDIEFEIATSEDTETLNFRRHRGRIYKVNNMIRTEERQQVYTIHFSSKETLLNQRTRVKSAYEGSGDEIAVKILQDVLKTNKAIAVEPSDLRTKLTGNNMKPFDFLNMVRDRCRSRVFEGAGFLFFENHRGYNLRTYESLSHTPSGPREPKEKFIVQPSARNVAIEDDMQSVTEYRITKNQDVLAASASGLLASTHYIYNRASKSYVKITQDYATMFDGIKHQERAPLFTTSPEEEGDNKSLFDFFEQRIDVSSRDTKLHQQSANDERNYNNHSNQKQLRRMISLSHDQITAKVTVPGNSNLAAGDLIELHVPSYEPIDKGETRVHDVFLSGRWIITNLVHAIGSERYTSTFDCVKDSVAVEYESTDSTIAAETNYKEPIYGESEVGDE